MGDLRFRNIVSEDLPKLNQLLCSNYLDLPVYYGDTLSLEYQEEPGYGKENVFVGTYNNEIIATVGVYRTELLMGEDSFNIVLLGNDAISHKYDSRYLMQLIRFVLESLDDVDLAIVYTGDQDFYSALGFDKVDLMDNIYRIHISENSTVKEANIVNKCRKATNKDTQLLIDLHNSCKNQQGIFLTRSQKFWQHRVNQKKKRWVFGNPKVHLYTYNSGTGYSILSQHDGYSIIYEAGIQDINVLYNIVNEAVYKEQKRGTKVIDFAFPRSRDVKEQMDKLGATEFLEASGCMLLPLKQSKRVTNLVNRLKKGFCINLLDRYSPSVHKFVFRLKRKTQINL